MAEQSIPSNLEEWLSANNINSLHQVLIEEDFDSVDELLVFDRDEIKKKLLNKGTVKLGKIAKLIIALDKYENEQNKTDENDKKTEVKDVVDDDDPNVKHYKYEHEFDANGILYAIGTDFGSTDYKNPLGKVKFSWQGLMTNGEHDTGFVGRDDHGATVKTDKKDIWYAVDFGKYHIKPTRFTLRSCYDFGRHRSFNLELQASHDANEWICLKEHPEIKLMKGKSDNGYSSTHSWEVFAKGYYRHFRIYIKNWKQHKPPNWDNNDNYIYLNLSGLELYGALKEVVSN